MGRTLSRVAGIVSAGALITVATAPAALARDGHHRPRDDDHDDAPRRPRPPRPRPRRRPGRLRSRPPGRRRRRDHRRHEDLEAGDHLHDLGDPAAAGRRLPGQHRRGRRRRRRRRQPDHQLRGRSAGRRGDPVPEHHRRPGPGRGRRPDLALLRARRPCRRARRPASSAGPARASRATAPSCSSRRRRRRPAPRTRRPASTARHHDQRAVEHRARHHGDVDDGRLDHGRRSGNAAPKAQVKVAPKGGIETGFGGTAW